MGSSSGGSSDTLGSTAAGQANNILQSAINTNMPAFNADYTQAANSLTAAQAQSQAQITAGYNTGQAQLAPMMAGGNEAMNAYLQSMGLAPVAAYSPAQNSLLSTNAPAATPAAAPAATTTPAPRQ